MVKKLILSCSFFIMGCGFYPISSDYKDPILKPYINNYINDKLLYLNTNKIHRISVTFKVLQDADGLCNIKYLENIITKHKTILSRDIYINPVVWAFLNESEKTILIYHEMGHCDLNLDHSNTNSIMNPYYFDGEEFYENRDHYLKLLFLKGI